MPVKKSNFASIGFQEIVEERAAARDIEFLQRTINTMSVKMDFVENQAIEAQNQVEELTQANIELEQKINKQYAIHGQDIKSLQDKLQIEQKKLNEFRVDTKSSQNIVGDKSQKDQVEQLTDTIQQYKKDIAQAQISVNQYKQQLYDVQVKYEAQSQQTQKLAAELATTKAQLQIAQDTQNQQQVHDLDDLEELQQVTNQLEQAKQSNEQLKTQVSQFNEEKKQFEIQLMDNQSKISQQKKEADQQKSEVLQYQQQIKECNNKLQTLELSLSTLRQLQSEDKASNEQSELLQQQLQLVEQQLSQRDQLIQSQDDQIASLQQQLGDLTKSLESQQEPVQRISLDADFNIQASNRVQKQFQSYVSNVRNSIKSYKIMISSQKTDLQKLVKINIPTFQIIAATEFLIQKYERNASAAEQTCNNIKLMLDAQMQKNNQFMEKADEEQTKLQLENESCQQTIKQLQQELENLKKQVVAQQQPSKTDKSSVGEPSVLSKLMRFGGIKPKDQSSVKEESTAVDIRDCIEISQANPNIDLGDIYVGEGFVNKSFKYKFIFTDPNASQIYSSFAVDLQPKGVSTKIHYSNQNFAIITITIVDPTMFLVQDISTAKISINARQRNQIISNLFCILELMYYVVPTIIGMPVDFFRDINMQDLYYAEYEGKRFIIVKDDVELGQNNIDSQPQFFRMLKNQIQSKIFAGELVVSSLFTTICFESQLLTELIEFTPQQKVKQLIKTIQKPEQIAQILEQMPHGPIRFLCELVISLRLGTSVDKQLNYKTVAERLFADPVYEKFLRALFQYQ